MSRATESGAYLGGIGTMLSQVDTCPSCGRTHPEGSRSSNGRTERNCTRVVVGALPYIAGKEFQVIPLGSEGTSPGPTPAQVKPTNTRKTARRDPPLAFLWPPLTPFTEVFP
jgi:hypothetical protein